MKNYLIIISLLLFSKVATASIFEYSCTDFNSVGKNMQSIISSSIFLGSVSSIAREDLLNQVIVVDKSINPGQHALSKFRKDSTKEYVNYKNGYSPITIMETIQQACNTEWGKTLAKKNKNGVEIITLFSIMQNFHKVRTMLSLPGVDGTGLEYALKAPTSLKK